jgi:hypothetical protein
MWLLTRLVYTENKPTTTYATPVTTLKNVFTVVSENFDTNIVHDLDIYPTCTQTLVFMMVWCLWYESAYMFEPVHAWQTLVIQLSTCVSCFTLFSCVGVFHAHAGGEVYTKICMRIFFALMSRSILTVCLTVTPIGETTKMVSSEDIPEGKNTSENPHSWRLFEWYECVFWVVWSIAVLVLLGYFVVVFYGVGVWVFNT